MMNETKAQTETHYTDADCRPYLDANDECRVCHVTHGDPCPDCNRRGYHATNCAAFVQTETSTANDDTAEIASRLSVVLDDFAGGMASTNADEGIDGDGLLIRVLQSGRMIEVRVSVVDVTDELTR